VKLVRSRAPLRLGLAGGGTDLSPYCDEYGGAVLNFTVNRFAYAFIEIRNDGKLVFKSSDLDQSETLQAVSELPTTEGLRLHRGVYNKMVREFNNGKPIAMTLTSFADVPAGSGLGTSSALVVSMVEAFRLLLDSPLGLYDVARLAYEIERNDLALAGGRQDQYAATFGGANFIEFLPNERVIVNPLRIQQRHIDELEASLVTCFTGKSRESAAIVVDQARQMTSKNMVALDSLHQLKTDAVQMKHALLTGNMMELAEIMQRSWKAKKNTAKAITNPKIDELFDFALKNGALAGKISGAGGGGFMMFLAAPETRPQLIKALRSRGTTADAVHFTLRGCESWTPEN
jgi:D-glycero-alpha-D-manno-heptose-7-phosphate kinase